MRHAYAFRSRWPVAAPRERCWALLERSLRTDTIAWWPAVRVVAAPARLAPRQTVDLEVRSPLGYRLRIGLAVTEVIASRTISATSGGDLSGRGRLELTDAPGGSILTWTWHVELRRRWMRAAAPVLRPVFVAAHRAVMRAGERGLAAQLAAEDGVATARGDEATRTRGQPPPAGHDRRPPPSEPRNAGNPGVDHGPGPGRR